MLLPGTLAAQDWVTWEMCNITDPVFDLSVYDELDVARAQTEAAAIPNPVGNFWEIQTSGGVISHLWGTTHSNHPTLLRLPGPVEKSVRSARVVALEFDPVLRSREELTRLWTDQDPYLGQTTHGTFKTNNFNDILGPELLGWIDARLETLGWGANAAEYMKPERIAEILLSAPCNDFATGIYPIQDSLIQTLGAIAGAEILSLEHPDSFRDKLADPANRALTFDLIRLYGWTLDPDQTRDEWRTGTAMYLEGRSALSLTLEREGLRAYFGDNRGPDMQDRVNGYLLDERNIRFIKTALPELEQGGVFIAVGSWHLPGEAGMVEMLRKAGYTVTRIPLPREAE